MQTKHIWTFSQVQGVFLEADARNVLDKSTNNAIRLENKSEQRKPHLPASGSDSGRILYFSLSFMQDSTQAASRELYCIEALSA